MRAALAVVCVLTTSAAADNKHPKDEPPPSEAQQLFDEGLKLSDEGKNEEACAKFSASIEKDPRGLGALMSLGRCNERSGKIATALALYQRAFDFATEANMPTSRDKAQERITALAPLVPSVSFEHLAPILDGEKLVIDKVVVASDTKDLPIDPGKHLVVLTAPQRLPWQTEIDVRASDHTTVKLPALEVPKSKIVTKRASSRHVVGKVIAISGVGLGLVAGGLAFYAKRDYDGLFEGSMPHCGVFPDIDGKKTCDDIGQSRSERDANIATGATVVGIVAGAAVATGVVLWLTAPKEYSQTQVVPAINGSSATVSLVGRF